MEPAVEAENATIFWDFAIHTDRKIDANKSDITIKDHKNNSCILVELMLPMAENLSSVELGKDIKIQGLGNRKRTNMAPKTNIDTSSCGSSWYSKKGTNEYLVQIRVKLSLAEIQKMSTVHILRKLLSKAEPKGFTSI